MLACAPWRSWSGESSVVLNPAKERREGWLESRGGGAALGHGRGFLEARDQIS